VGTISALITDATGAVLKDATVATVPSTSSVKTDVAGKAELKNVPLGVYTVTVTLSGYKVGVQSGVSVAAGQTSTVTLSLVKGEEFSLIRIVGIPEGYKDKVPTGEKVATLAAGDSVDVKTNALGNVAVGSYVFLKGATVDPGDKAVTAWKWTLVPPSGSTATLEFWDGTTADASKYRTWQSTTQYQNARFRADAKGVFTVQIEVTSSAGKFTSSTDVYSGTYVGAATCMSCHNNQSAVGEFKDVYTDWTATGHATKFEGSFNSYGWSGTKYSDYCIQCHVTGYDESSPSGGFDEMAKLSGWDPTQGSVGAWIKPQTGSPKWADINAFVADPSTAPMQKLMNIQCESCHGPGSNHPEAKAHLTFDGAMCEQCHGQPKQWARSKHGIEPPEHMAGSSSCIPCHTGQGFVVNMIQNKAIVTPDQAYPGNPATVFETGSAQHIGCATCHDPHKFSYPHQSGTAWKSNQLRVEADYKAPMGFTVSAKESTACNMCHTNKRDTKYFADYLANKKTRGPHSSTQGDMLAGEGGYEYAGKSYSSSAHTNLISGECIKCHMHTEASVACSATAPCPPYQVCSKGKCKDDKVGGHTWAMTWTDTSVTPATEYEHLSSCNQTGCHATALTKFDRTAFTDHDGDGTKEGIQKEIGDLLAALEAKLPKDSTGKVPESGLDKLSLTAKQLQALWNYWVVMSDGSLGVHNTKYVGELLCDSLKDLDPTASCNR